jgi:hypothetical protein
MVWWAQHASGASIEYMGIDLGGFYIAVAQQFLDVTDVLPFLQQVGREPVAER